MIIGIMIIKIMTIRRNQKNDCQNDINLNNNSQKNNNNNNKNNNNDNQSNNNSHHKERNKKSRVKIEEY